MGVIFLAGRTRPSPVRGCIYHSVDVAHIEYFGCRIGECSESVSLVFFGCLQSGVGCCLGNRKLSEIEKSLSKMSNFSYNTVAIASNVF